MNIDDLILMLFHFLTPGKFNHMNVSKKGCYTGTHATAFSGTHHYWAQNDSLLIENGSTPEKLRRVSFLFSSEGALNEIVLAKGPRRENDSDVTERITLNTETSMTNSDILIITSGHLSSE